MMTHVGGAMDTRDGESGGCWDRKRGEGRLGP